MIAFISVGALAELVIRGALGAQALTTRDFVVTARRRERAEALAALGWRVASNRDAARDADAVVLGVRHGDLPPLLFDVRGELRGKLLVSMVVGSRRRHGTRESTRRK